LGDKYFIIIKLYCSLVDIGTLRAITLLLEFGIYYSIICFKIELGEDFDLYERLSKRI